MHQWHYKLQISLLYVSTLSLQRDCVPLHQAVQNAYQALQSPGGENDIMYVSTHGQATLQLFLWIEIRMLTGPYQASHLTAA